MECHTGQHHRITLTVQDLSIMRLLVECANDETIARRLSISVRTVRRRIARIMDLLGVSNRFAAGVAVASLGLLPCTHRGCTGFDCDRSIKTELVSALFQ